MPGSKVSQQNSAYNEMINVTNFACQWFFVLMFVQTLNMCTRMHARLCVCVCVPQQYGDLTGTYDHLTNSLIKVMHPPISSEKANDDPHIYIHLVYIWCLKQPANDN